ncbi:Ig-like domain-containing protein, partial [Psychromarinibacter halotolerans]
EAGDGADLGLGGDGDDTILGGLGDDTLQGGEGADSLDGGDDADVLYGQAGDDTLIGGAGADFLNGGVGNDSVVGDAGNDTIDGGSGDDALEGGAGDDSLTDYNSSTEVNSFSGGEGDDTLRGYGTYFDGGIGQDRIDFVDQSGADIFVNGGDGADTISRYGSVVTDTAVLIDGGAGDDTITGTRYGLDTILGGDGNDSINGGTTSTWSGYRPDSIDGGAGDDTIIGSGLDDTLEGGADNDSIEGNSGNDQIFGGTGDDIIRGGVGDDTIFGGGESGDGPGDIAIYSGTRAQYTVIGDQTGLQVIHNTGSDGTDVLTDVEVLRFSDGDLPVATGFTGVDLLGTSGDDNGLPGNPGALVGTILNDTIQGLAGDDSLVGLDGQDTLDGGDGADTIEAGGEDDSVLGGDGNDLLTGGGGDDTLEGGAGLDVAVYAGDSADFLIAGDDTSATVTDLNAADGDEGSDTLSGIRILRFADQDVVFNQVPVTDGEAFSSDEDSVFEIATSVLLEGDTDPDADPLTITAVQNATNGTVQLIGDTVRFTPDPDYFGPASFDYVVSDGYETSVQAVTVDILSVNDAPVAVADAAETDFEAAVTLNVLDNDSDPEGDPLQLTGTGPASHGTVTVGSGGEVTYTPLAGFSGTDTFSYTVEDGNGGSMTGQVAITVLAPPNTPPEAADDSFATLETQTVAGEVLGNDTDTDADPLTVYAVEGLTAVVGSSYTLASGAVVTMQTNGTFVYDPDGAFDLASGESATDSFTYTISDGEGGFSEAVVNIDLTGVGAPPVATQDAYSSDEETPVVGNVITDDTGTGADSDPDGDDITVIAVEGRPIADGPITLVSGAVVTMAPDGSFTYDPSGAQDALGEGATGTDTFTYTISDGAGGVTKSAAVITLAGVNDAPVAADDAYEVVETSVLTGNVIKLPEEEDCGCGGTVTVLEDGTDVDPDGDALVVSAVNGSTSDVGAQITLASGALLLLNADGSFSYDPNGAFSTLAYGETGADSFQYTVDDGAGGSDTALVTLSVNGIAGAPDLVVSDVEFEGGKTDEWVSVSYRVDNLGGATLPDTGWTDKLFLSIDTVLDENDIFLRDLSFSGTLDAGSFYERSATVKMPGENGDYYLLVKTDAGGSTVLEVDESNNIGASLAPAGVLPAYHSTLVANTGSVVGGEAIQLSGQAIDVETGEAAPFEFVTIEAEIDGTTRTIDVLTDITGQWSTSFTTLPGQGGTLSLNAHHPGNPGEDAAPEATVDIFGMDILEDYVTFEVVNGQSGTLSLTLDNFGDLDLTGLNATIEGLPTSWNVTPVLEATTLAGDGTITLDLNATMPEVTAYDFTDVVVRVTSDQGAETSANVRIDPVSSLADLVIEQTSIEGFALRGEQELVSFTITNEGSTASAPITVLLPELDWMGLATPQVIESLGAGESREIFVSLTPDDDVPFGTFSGSISVSEAGGDFASLPFTFYTASDATGTLELNLVDELFYFSDEAPKVDDGRVTVTNAVTGEIVFSSMDVDGMVTISDIPEGLYNVRIDAKDHDSYQSTIEINPGQTNSIDAFMSKQTVKYYWSVEETEVEDRYTVNVEAEFATDVPEPVVVIDPPLIDLAELDQVGEEIVVEMTATNYGLIAVNNFELNIGDHPFYNFDYPEGAFDVLDAKSEITIPIKITRVADFEVEAEESNIVLEKGLLGDMADEKMGALSTFDAPGAVPASEPVSCVIQAEVYFSYPCGPNDVYKVVSIGIANADGNCDDGVPGGFGFGGGGLGGGFGGGGGAGGGGAGGGFSSGGPNGGTPQQPVFSPVIPIPKVDLCDLVDPFVDCGKTFAPQFAPAFDFVRFIAQGPGGGNANDLAGSVAQGLEDYFDPDQIDGLAPLGRIEDGIKCARALADLLGWKQGVDFLDNVLAYTGKVLPIATIVDDFDDIGDILDLEDLGDFVDLADDVVEIVNGLTGVSQPSDASPMSLHAAPAMLETGMTDAQLALSLALSSFNASLDYQSYLFGDQAWLDTEDAAGVSGWIGEFSAFLVDGARRLTVEEKGYLLGLTLPDDISSDEAEAFLERWNRSIDYWNAGIINEEDVPNGMSSDFIALDRLEVLASAYISHGLIADAYGYSDLSSLTEQALNLVEAEQTAPVGGVCASVRISISQDVVLTRQAFLAELEIVNETTKDLSNIALQIEVRDSSGNLVEQTEFGITDPFLDGSLTAIDGTGVIAGGESGSATFTLVPSRLAAASGEETYTISGSLSYVENGVQVAVPLRQEEITVRPQAELELDYFMQRNVFSDDPFTDDVVEVSQPFALGILVNNVGAGDATNLSITSAQPKIIENEKGLLIDFEILGTEVNGEGVAPTLNADFGDIAAGDAETAVWLMQSSLQGKFVDYDVSFTHENSLGFEELSLITETRIHELVQVVQDDRSGSDGLSDFLVNDDWETDPTALPDTLYTSDGEVLAVALATGEVADGVAGPSDLVVEVTATMAAGYSYASLLDPGAGEYTIASIVRESDGKVLLDANYWQTDRTFPPSGRPEYEDVLHLLDHNETAGPQTYIVTYTAKNVGPTANDDTVLTDENTSISFDALANDTDPEGDPLSVVGVTQGADGSVVVGTSGTLIYTPDANFTGSDSFTYTIVDGNGGTSVGTVDVTVNDIANPASSVSIEVGTGNPDDAGFTSFASSAGSEGADGNTEVWFVVRRLGDLSGDVDVSLQLSTTADSDDYSGSVPQTVTLRSGVEESYFRLDVFGDDVIEADEDLTVAITGTSRADVVTEPGASSATYTIENDDLASTVSVAVTRVGSGETPSTTSSFTEGDSGSYDLSFTVTRTGDLTGAVTLTLAALGTVNAADIAGSIPDEVTLVDGQASVSFVVSVTGDTEFESDEDVGVELVSTDRTNVSIDPTGQTAIHTILNDDVPNLAPQGIDDRADTAESAAIVIDVLGNDSDPEGGPISLVSVAAPLFGSAEITAAGMIEYVPMPGFVGSDRFFYVIDDDEGQISTAEVVVTVAPTGSTFVLGTPESDDLSASGDTEYFELQGSNDTISGSLSDFDGDTVSDFGTGDAIVLQEASLSPDDVTVVAGSAILSFDANGDGTPESVLTLEGDFSGETFEVSSVNGETTVVLAGPAASQLTPAGERFITEDAGPNRVYGDGGDDVIATSAGDDMVSSGAGDDVVLAGSGNDTIIGGLGADNLTGGEGSDMFAFSAGDFQVGGFTADFVTDFTPGEDIIELSGFGITDPGSLSFITVAEGDAIDLGSGRFIVLEGLSQSDLLPGDIVATEFARTYGLIATNPVHNLTDADDRFISTDTGATEIFAGGGDDAIVGGSGDDTIRGESGADVLVGGAGNDKLIGGEGADQLSGRDGADVFEFTFGEETTFVAEFITDYEVGTDTLDLIDFGYSSAGDLTFTTAGSGDVAIQLTPSRFIVFEGHTDVAAIEADASTWNFV